MLNKFYIGNGTKISAGDFTEIAKRYNIPESNLRAITEVEARGSGFDSSNRLIALYEPHIAFKYTSGAVRNKLVALGIAYPKWKRNYPKTSYDRIDQCTAVAGMETAAMATSWGMGQVMGFNHAALGYPSALSMVVAFAQGEAAQVEGMVKFIVAKGLINALRAGKWEAVALGYNGAGEAQNGYHIKLANAAKHWDLKLNNSDAKAKGLKLVSADTLDIGTKGKEVASFQNGLAIAGYDISSDGDFGGHTEEVTKQFQEANGLTPDGVAGPATRTTLANQLTVVGQDPNIATGAPVIIPANPTLDQPVTHSSQFFAWLGTLPLAGALTQFTDWRIIITLFGCFIALAVFGILGHKYILDAYKNTKQAIKEIN